MLPSLLVAALLATQDLKPATRTVEERLKELGDRLTALEQKGKTLTEENAALERQIRDIKAAREKQARHSAAVWVQRYAAAVQFTEAQAGELEELWVVWTKEDQERGGDEARWKAREETLRSKLTRDQIPRFTRRVRDEREENVKTSITMLARMAKLPPEKSSFLGEAAVRKLSIAEGAILIQAHPQETADSWTSILAAVEASTSEPASPLTEEERASLQKVLGRWKPGPR